MYALSKREQSIENKGTNRYPIWKLAHKSYSIFRQTLDKLLDKHVFTGTNSVNENSYYKLHGHSLFQRRSHLPDSCIAKARI